MEVEEDKGEHWAPGPVASQLEGPVGCVFSVVASSCCVDCLMIVTRHMSFAAPSLERDATTSTRADGAPHASARAGGVC